MDSKERELCEKERKYLYTVLKAQSIPELKIRLIIAKILCILQIQNYIKIKGSESGN
jgi:hypothetical protein